MVLRAWQPTDGSAVLLEGGQSLGTLNMLAAGVSAIQCRNSIDTAGG